MQNIRLPIESLPRGGIYRQKQIIAELHAMNNLTQFSRSAARHVKNGFRVGEAYLFIVEVLYIISWVCFPTVLEMHLLHKLMQLALASYHRGPNRYHLPRYANIFVAVAHSFMVVGRFRGQVRMRVQDLRTKKLRIWRRLNVGSLSRRRQSGGIRTFIVYPYVRDQK